MTEPVLPQSSYDRLRAVCEDILLWDHIDPDCYMGYRPIPDSEYWEEVPPLVTGYEPPTREPANDDCWPSHDR